jgi:hypothetical protein
MARLMDFQRQQSIRQTLNGMILYYCLMTKRCGLGDSMELSRVGLSHLKCIQTLKIRVRITYAELLDPSPGGPVSVGEGHVRRRRVIVPRNVREPSKEVSVPRRGDVDRPHRLAAHGSPPNIIAASSRLRVISPTGKWNVCVSCRHRSMNAMISGAS